MSRYEILFKLASGGMATVYLGAARGALGFRQLVAIKRPHPHLLEDPSYRKELVAEARLASLIHHANVVDIRDVEMDGNDVSLVMDYVEGASLGELIVAASKKELALPPGVAVRVVLDACAGLAAAHDLVDEKGRPVGLVHRDISPQNVLVGSDGVGRVSDFGVAKVTAALSTTHGALKGKLAYMAPEYLRNEKIDKRMDVFAMGVVLWEALSGKRLFKGANEPETFNKVLDMPAPLLDSPFDSVLQTALAKNRDERFENIGAMASALESSGPVARHAEVAQTMKDLLGPSLDERRAKIRARLSLEPSVLSLMSADPPPLDLDSRPTLADAVTEPSKGYAPVEIPGVPREGSSKKWLLPLALIFGISAAFAIVVAWRSSQAPIASPASATESASATASATASTSATATAAAAASVSATATASAAPELASFGAAWLSCRKDSDCTVVSLGCCSARAVNRAHEKDGQKALDASGMPYCPPKAPCAPAPVSCAHAICKLAKP